MKMVTPLLLTTTILTAATVSSAMPHQNRNLDRAAEIIAQKPMHTTALMAGAAATVTRPTSAPTSSVMPREWEEL